MLFWLTETEMNPFLAESVPLHIKLEEDGLLGNILDLYSNHFPTSISVSNFFRLLI